MDIYTRSDNAFKGFVENRALPFFKWLSLKVTRTFPLIINLILTFPNLLMIYIFTRFLWWPRMTRILPASCWGFLLLTFSSILHSIFSWNSGIFFIINLLLYTSFYILMKLRHLFYFSVEKGRTYFILNNSCKSIFFLLYIF